MFVAHCSCFHVFLEGFVSCVCFFHVVVSHKLFSLKALSGWRFDVCMIFTTS